MTILMGWIARSRTKNRKDKNPNDLRAPGILLVLAVVGVLLFGGAAVFSNVYSNGTETWWTTTGFVGFALLGLMLAIDCLMTRHRLSESGLRYGRWFRPSRSLQWSELLSVRYAPFLTMFRLEAANGEVAWISAYLMGLPEFARLILRHAPSGSIEHETTKVLQETAAGKPPAIW